MKLKRNPRAIERHGHSQGSWLSVDDRWVIDGDGRRWAIMPNSLLDQPFELHLCTYGISGDFPTRRQAIAALELSLAAAPALPEVKPGIEAVLQAALDGLALPERIAVSALLSHCDSYQTLAELLGPSELL